MAPSQPAAHNQTDEHLRSADAEHFLDHVLRARELFGLEFRGVDGRGVEGGDAQDGGVEVVEAFLHEHGADLRADAAEGFVFLDVDGAVGFADAGEDGFLVERTNRADVDDFGVDVVLGGEEFGGLDRGQRGAAVSD